MKKIVVFTGAGISKESGLDTFRGDDGLWEGYRIENVATPEAWAKNPQLVQRFYNQRRKAVLNAQPNQAHYALRKLENKFDVQIITQNIDDLHERAGSSNVVHLHGLITKAQSSIDSNLLYELKKTDIEMGEFCEKGSQLRPHVVWFGEAVPHMFQAIEHCRTANYFIVIGTSLAVYPAANLLYYVPDTAKKYLIDPYAESLQVDFSVKKITQPASLGVPELVQSLLNQKY